ncbi:unnamed protein product [Rotaria magnacalcarata]
MKWCSNIYQASETLEKHQEKFFVQESSFMIANNNIAKKNKLRDDSLYTYKIVGTTISRFIHSSYLVVKSFVVVSN